jgi:hypothetical protein
MEPSTVVLILLSIVPGIFFATLIVGGIVELRKYLRSRKPPATTTGHYYDNQIWIRDDKRLVFLTVGGDPDSTEVNAICLFDKAETFSLGERIRINRITLIDHYNLVYNIQDLDIPSLIEESTIYA